MKRKSNDFIYKYYIFVYHFKKSIVKIRKQTYMAYDMHYWFDVIFLDEYFNESYKFLASGNRRKRDRY